MASPGLQYVRSLGREAGNAIEEAIGRSVSASVDLEVKENQNSLLFSSTGFPASNLLKYIVAPFRSNRLGRALSHDWIVVHVADRHLPNAVTVVHSSFQVIYPEGDRTQLSQRQRTYAGGLALNSGGDLVVDGTPIVQMEAQVQARGEAFLTSSFYYHTARAPTSTLAQKLADISAVTGKKHVVILGMSELYAHDSLVTLTTTFGGHQGQFRLIMLSNIPLQTQGLVSTVHNSMTSDPLTVDLVHNFVSERYSIITREGIERILATTGLDPLRTRLLMETVYGYHKSEGIRGTIDGQYVEAVLRKVGPDAYG